MSNEDQPHREWEMTPGAQRRLTVGIAVVATLVVLINLLVGGPSPNIWDQLQPSGVAHRLANSSLLAGDPIPSR